MQSFRDVYFVRLLHALRCVDWSPKKLEVLRRRRDIKVAADASLALTSMRKGVGSLWSRALLTNISSQQSNKHLLKKIASVKVKDIKMISSVANWLPFRSHQSTLKRLGFRRARAKRIKRIDASTIARRMVKDRTEILQRLVPGGQSMDKFSLLEETADYIASLRAQVEVMKFLANAFSTN